MILLCAGETILGKRTRDEEIEQPGGSTSVPRPALPKLEFKIVKQSKKEGKPRAQTATIAGKQPKGSGDLSSGDTLEAMEKAAKEAHATKNGKALLVRRATRLT